jgi:hypothetical protein
LENFRSQHPPINHASVFPASFDPISACPGALFCCDVSSTNVSSCCGNSFSLDVAATTVTVLPTVDAATSPTGQPNNSSTTSALSNPSPHTGHKNSTIGIAVGVSIAGLILALCGVAILLWNKRRQRNKSENIGQTAAEARVADKPGYHDYSQAAIPVKSHVAELEGHKVVAPVELDSTR